MKTNRPELEKALTHLRRGDTLVVWKLDRLGRSMAHLITIVNGLNERGINFRCLDYDINTATPIGMLFFQFMAALAQFERSLIWERSEASRLAAAERGRKGGRPEGVTAAARQTAKTAAILYSSQNMSIKQISSQLGISVQTLYNYLRHEGITVGKPIAQPVTE